MNDSENGMNENDIFIDLDKILVDTDQLKTGRGGGKKGTGERYTKYLKCVEKHKIDVWLKSRIKASKDGIVRVKLAQLAEKCGRKLRTNPRGPGYSDTGLLWGFRFALWGKGIKTSLGHTKTEEPVAIFELRGPDDILPSSLRKYYVEPVKPVEPIKPGSSSTVADEAGVSGAGNPDSEQQSEQPSEQTTEV